MIAKLKYRKNETDQWRAAILLDFSCIHEPNKVIMVDILGKSKLLKNDGYYFQIEWEKIAANFYGLVLETTDKKITIVPATMIDLT